MKFDTPATTNPIDQLKVIGKPADRIDGPLKVTGTAPYAYERHDVAANQAYGYVLGSAIAKGRINAMDTAAARRAPGVLAIVTALDVPRLEKAQLNFFVGGPGPEIKVEGGGAGWDNSNCTNDETRTTVTAGDDPTVVPISFVAKSSGSCAIERSFSYFNIKFSGTSRSGKSVRGEARILFGQDYAGEDYKVTCISTSPSVSCDKVGMRTLQLRYS